MRMWVGAALVGAVMMAAPASAAVVMDFDNGTPAGIGGYSQNGFNLSITPEAGVNSAISLFGNPGNGTNAFAFCSLDGGCTDGTSLRLTNGSTFSIGSIDGATYTAGEFGQYTFTGSIFGGGTVSQSFTMTDAFSTYVLSGFNNLTSLDISASGAYGGVIDNINAGAAVSAAPEPGTWAMMMFGFGAVGGVLRRKQRQRLNATSTKVAFA